VSDSKSNPLWVIVPIKGFSQGKSRLRGVTCEPEREAFNSYCAHHVLNTLQQCHEVDQLLIATNDDWIAQWAQDNGLKWIRDEVGATLNESLQRALNYAQLKGAAAGLVVFADLPFLDVDAVEEFAHALNSSRCVLGPDRRKEGTNALGVRFPTEVSLHFEEFQSYHRHREACLKKGITVRAVERFEWGFDVDLPTDFNEFKSMTTWPALALKNVS
jgi:2-phospho-L-lactate guanylyltransferase